MRGLDALTMAFQYFHFGENAHEPSSNREEELEGCRRQVVFNHRLSGFGYLLSHNVAYVIAIPEYREVAIFRDIHNHNENYLRSQIVTINVSPWWSFFNFDRVRVPRRR